MLNKSLTDSWSFFKNNIVAISAIVLPITIPVEIFTVFYQYSLTSEELVLSEQLFPTAIMLLTYPIYAVGVIFYIVSTVSGERSDTKTLWNLGIKYWAPYFVLTIITIIATTLGLMLFIIPGIILLVRLSFSEFDLLLNKSKPLAAMHNSWASTKEYIWVLLFGIAVITIVLYTPFFLVSSLFEEASTLYWAFDSATNIAYSVFNVLYTIFAFRVYELAGKPGAESNST